MSDGTHDAPTAVVITVGDELLAGRVVDAHSAWVSTRLVQAGLRVVRHVSVGDAPGELAAAIADPQPVDVTVIAGGLGPTEDDRTRSEVATALGEELEFRDDVWEQVAKFMRRRGVTPGESNRRQAWFPRSATVVENRRGTAPAFRVERDGREWWALPGVRHEFHALVDDELIPHVRERWPSAAEPSPPLRFFGVPESRLDAWFSEQLTVIGGNLHDYHIRVTRYEIEVHLPSGVELHEPALRDFGHGFVGAGHEDLAERVVEQATRDGVSIATAESCTGGRVGARITEVPGASTPYLGGWVVYSNAAKVELGVSAAAIEEHGAVSSEVAEQLAASARERSGAEYAVATTGVAGPGGGTPEKPVGTVWFGVASPRGVESGVFRFSGDRRAIQGRSTAFALHALLRALRGETAFGSA